MPWHKMFSEVRLGLGSGRAVISISVLTGNSSNFICGPRGACSLELDLDEYKFTVIRIDDVMFDTGRTRIGLTECKLVFHWTGCRLSQ